jgi:hypothetical protein
MTKEMIPTEVEKRITEQTLLVLYTKESIKASIQLKNQQRMIKIKIKIRKCRNMEKEA